MSDLIQTAKQALESANEIIIHLIENHPTAKHHRKTGEALIQVDGAIRAIARAENFQSETSFERKEPDSLRAEPVERKWPLMGYGNVSIGGCKQPDGTSGLIYLDMGETREIDADTTDLFPVGSEADPSKLLACIYFKDGSAIQQTIDVLREMQIEIGYAAPLQPVKQVPVGIVLLHEGDVNAKGYLYNPLPEGTKLYAAPVERPWVDLTDDELKAALEVHQVGLSVRIGRIAIAAFKEKNR